MSDDTVDGDNLIEVTFGRAPQHSHADRPATANAEGPPRLDDPLSGLYSTGDVARLFEFSTGRLRYWNRTDLLKPSAEVDGRRYYTFQDLIGVRTARGLLQAGVALSEVRLALGSLKKTLPSVSRPLSELRVMADGGSVVVRDEEGSFEPTTGQTVLDFNVSAIQAQVVQMLHVTEEARRRAYEHYLEACRLDEDEATADKAEALYRKALRLDPTLSNALTNLGNLCYRRDQLDQAERYYLEALQIDPSQPEAHYDLGLIYFERGEVPAAITEFQAALSRDPSFADAHFNLAMAYEECNRATEARPHWQMYVRLEPTGAWTVIAREHLARNP